MIFQFPLGFHNASNFSWRLLEEIGLSPLLKNSLPRRLCWQSSYPFSYLTCEILIQRESPLIAGFDNWFCWILQVFVTACAKVRLLLPVGDGATDAIIAKPNKYTTQNQIAQTKIQRHPKISTNKQNWKPNTTHSTAWKWKGEEHLTLSESPKRQEHQIESTKTSRIGDGSAESGGQQIRKKKKDNRCRRRQTLRGLLFIAITFFFLCTVRIEVVIIVFSSFQVVIQLIISHMQKKNYLSLSIIKI